jgi:hypothetical protein
VTGFGGGVDAASILSLGGLGDLGHASGSVDAEVVALPETTAATAAVPRAPSASLVGRTVSSGGNINALLLVLGAGLTVLPSLLLSGASGDGAEAMGTDEQGFSKGNQERGLTLR